MWDRIKTFFKNSETIAWAWLNMAVGSIASVLAFVDPELVQALLTPQTFGFYVLANGVATKWLRQRREEDM